MNFIKYILDTNSLFAANQILRIYAKFHMHNHIKSEKYGVFIYKKRKYTNIRASAWFLCTQTCAHVYTQSAGIKKLGIFDEFYRIYSGHEQFSCRPSIWCYVAAAIVILWQPLYCCRTAAGFVFFSTKRSGRIIIMGTAVLQNAAFVAGEISKRRFRHICTKKLLVLSISHLSPCPNRRTSGNNNRIAAAKRQPPYC